MKTHTRLGHDIVLAADMPVEARWVLHHHERIDGCGYPDGLSGEDIPLQSRIIHVADAFEAMTSDRPYRMAPGEQFAIRRAAIQRRKPVRLRCRRGAAARSRPSPTGPGDPPASPVPA